LKTRDKITPPEWGLEVHKTLFELKITKFELSKMLEVNYSNLCNIISGRRIDLNIQEKILAKIAELEQEARRAV